MPYVRIPKDLTDFKPKFLLGLTLRQIACASLAVGICAPSYYVIRATTNNLDLANWAVILIGLPLFSFALIKKNEMPLEKFLLIAIKSTLLNSKIRTYKTENIFETLAEASDLGTEGVDDTEDIVPEKSKKRRFSRRNGSSESKSGFTA